MTYYLPPNSQGSFCAGCNARIFWAKTDAGKWLPVDTDLKPHWATCPESKRFRKPMINHETDFLLLVFQKSHHVNRNRAMVRASATG